MSTITYLYTYVQNALQYKMELTCKKKNQIMSINQSNNKHIFYATLRNSKSIFSNQFRSEKWIIANLTLTHYTILEILWLICYTIKPTLEHCHEMLRQRLFLLLRDSTKWREIRAEKKRLIWINYKWLTICTYNGLFILYQMINDDTLIGVVLIFLLKPYTHR